jgi:hypothetical protein
VFFLSLFNFISYYKVSRDNLTFTHAIKYLAKSIELWLLNHSIRKVLYDNKSNQGFSNNCDIKAALKGLYIKLFSISYRLSLIVKLFNLAVHSFLILSKSLLNINICQIIR